MKSNMNKRKKLFKMETQEQTMNMKGSDTTEKELKDIEIQNNSAEVKEVPVMEKDTVENKNVEIQNNKESEQIQAINDNLTEANGKIEKNCSMENSSYQNKFIEELNLKIENKKSELAKLSANIVEKKLECDEISRNINEQKKLLQSYDEKIKKAEEKYSDLISDGEKEKNSYILAGQKENEKLIKKAKEESDSIIASAKNNADELLKNATEIKNNADKMLKNASEKEKNLNDRENEIIEKEKQAESGFEEKYNEEMAKMIQEKKGIYDEITELNETLCTKKNEIDNSILEYKKDREEKVNKELESIRNQLQQKENDLNEKEKELIKKENQLSIEKSYLEADKNKIEDEKDKNEKYIEDRVKEEYLCLLVEKESLSKKLNKVKIEFKKIRDERDDFAIRIGNYKNSDVGKQADRIKLLENKIDELNNKYEDGIEKEELEEIRGKAQKFDSLKEKFNDLAERCSKAETELAKNYDQSKMLKYKNEYNAQLEGEVEKLTEELRKKEIITKSQRMESIKRELPELSKLDELNCFSEEYNDERKWLDYIQKQAELSGIVFSKRLINAYHTSLKIGEWSPLVVLAGVSGTGKSELPRQYALHGGMNFLSIAVKPDWDSPQSLFGYYNSIENKFEPTELLRALYQMQADVDQNKSNQMLMVLLDEMNLAYVELYFSDLLSKFETRRGTDSPVQYEISLGAGSESEILKIGNNVLWTGTMNEDETTKALSDKVVDRSTLITFPRPKKLISRTKTINQKAKYFLKKSQWDKWVNNAIDINSLPKDIMDDLKSTVEKINEYMSGLGRNLGHRVWQGIENYICNYPDLINCKDDNEKKKYIDNAFAEAVAFKIMPKLRGVETGGESEDIINDIAKVINEKIPQLQNDFTKAKSLPSKIFMWHSAEFLEEQEK